MLKGTLPVLTTVVGVGTTFSIEVGKVVLLSQRCELIFHERKDGTAIYPESVEERRTRWFRRVAYAAKMTFLSQLDILHVSFTCRYQEGESRRARLSRRAVAGLPLNWQILLFFES